MKFAILALLGAAASAVSLPMESPEMPQFDKSELNAEDTAFLKKIQEGLGSEDVVSSIEDFPCDGTGCVNVIAS